MHPKFINDVINFTVYDGLGNIVAQGNSRDFGITKVSIKGDINKMEQFNLEKHWNDFLNGKLVVNCKTEELANEFLEYCHLQGITWCTGKYLISHNNWDNYNEETCYINDCGFSFSNVDYYKSNNYTIVEFNGLNTNTYKHTPKSKPPLGVMSKDIFELFRVQELCKALYNHSTFEEVDYDLMIKWSNELNDRLYGLKDSVS